MIPLILLTLVVEKNHLDDHEGHLVECEEVMGELTRDTIATRRVHIEHV